jgi:hypothetical protein
MILIEVNNSNTANNFELIAKTVNWAEANIDGRYTIVLNPHLEQEMRITYHDHGETSNAPLGTNSKTNTTNSDKAKWIIP